MCRYVQCVKPLLNEEELADTEKVTALWSIGSALGAILGGVCVGGLMCGWV